MRTERDLHPPALSSGRLFRSALLLLTLLGRWQRRYASAQLLIGKEKSLPGSRTLNQYIFFGLMVFN